MDKIDVRNYFIDVFGDKKFEEIEKKSSGTNIKHFTHYMIAADIANSTFKSIFVKMVCFWGMDRTLQLISDNWNTKINPYNDKSMGHYLGSLLCGNVFKSKSTNTACLDYYEKLMAGLTV